MVKCKPVYKNLNLIKSFSEQQYATVQWAEQCCQNDEWLRQQVEKLKYLTPPAIRKNYNIRTFFDEKSSYGCKVNGGEVGFNNSVSESILVDFTDMSLIDYSKSTVDFVTEDIGDGESVTYCRLQQHPVKTPPNVETFGTSTGGSNNSFWYVGYNKSKNYNLKADWLKDWKRYDIPSVCRAQTFKAKYSGALTSIDLKLDYNGSSSKSCASPVYVQIWKTYKKFVPKTKWNKTKKKMEYNYVPYTSKYKGYQRYNRYQKKLKYTSGKHKGEYKKDKNGHILTETAYRKASNGTYVIEREYIQWLGHNKKNPKYQKGVNNPYLSDVYHPLAEAVYDKAGNPWPNIQFEKPVNIKKDETYAIVVFSPLSDWKHCPRWGGWGRNCKRDNIYPDGNAFMSEDNGRTWKRYGKNGVDTGENGKLLEYKKGKYTPQDFAFQCHVETNSGSSSAVYNDDVEYLYLNPIFSNPIRQVILSYNDNGSETVNSDNHIHVEYEYSTDGDYWTKVTNTSMITFDENKPTMLLFRAKLWRDTNVVEGNDTYGNLTPHIENININLVTVPAKEMYARTSFHDPNTEGILGASVWGCIFAPFSKDATVNCGVEIIQGSTVTDHFDFIRLNDVDEKLSLLGLDYPVVANYIDEERAIYLTDHPEILTELKSRYVYVKPYEFENKLYLLSFSPSPEDMIVYKTSDDDAFSDYDLGGLSFSNEVAFPIQKVRLQAPEHEGLDNGVDVFSEWIDYTFDYENNKLIFKPETIDDIVDGDLYITYNPVFISGLSPEEVGIHIDSGTGLYSEGLILDYFKETILVEEVHLETRRVSLKAKPVDPIRQVYLYKNGIDDEPLELFENKDFILDIESNELVFTVNVNDSETIILSQGDILEIVYTPNLEDNKIALGYYATRDDIDMQVHIKDVYFEVKV